VCFNCTIGHQPIAVGELTLILPIPITGKSFELLFQGKRKPAFDPSFGSSTALT
jgi:hypothetical protein